MILTPLNTSFFTVLFEEVDPTTFVATPITTGTVTAFLATSSDPLATTADPSLSVAAVHVGVASPTPEQYPLGTWGITFPATALTPTLLDALYHNTGSVPYLIVVLAGGARIFQQLSYVRTRAASN